VEKENPRPSGMARVKTARDRNTVFHGNEEVECTARARREILTGIEDILQEGRLVDAGVVNHRLTLAPKEKRRKRFLAVGPVKGNCRKRRIERHQTNLVIFY
jgi:hypothetical protein